jgi:RNA polymerase primary sigma factor
MNGFPALATLSLHEEELKLVKKAKRGNRAAADALVESCLGLVFKIARQYGYLDDVKDLAQEGAIGLLKAIDSFDPSLGAPFTAYAKVWVRGAILAWLRNKTRTVRYPEDLHHHASKIHRMQQQEGRDFTPEEIRLALGCTEAMATHVHQLLNPDHMVRLDYAPEECPDATIGDLMPDLTQDVAEASARSDEHRRVREALETLPNRQREMIEAYYGIGCPQTTCRKLAALHGVSNQRIVQIVRAGEAKLRRKVRR